MCRIPRGSIYHREGTVPGEEWLSYAAYFLQSSTLLLPIGHFSCQSSLHLALYNRDQTSTAQEARHWSPRFTTVSDTQDLFVHQQDFHPRCDDL